jgi:GAF domain-containing protein
LPALNQCRTSSRDTSICGHVVAGGEMVVVRDVAKDGRFAGNPFLLENGIRFYAGAPLRTSSGFVLGSLCVIDTKPRIFAQTEQKLLQLIADELMAKIEARCTQGETARGGSPTEMRTLASGGRQENGNLAISNALNSPI